jgi:hypothetical protein
MSKVFIPDGMFDVAVNEYGATQENINQFMNELANEFTAKWEPVSDGYNLQIDDIDASVAYATDDLEGRINDWAERL